MDCDSESQKDMFADSSASSFEEAQRFFNDSENDKPQNKVLKNEESS